MSQFAISIDAHVNIQGMLMVAVTSEIENDEMLSAILASTAMQCCNDDKYDAIGILADSISRINNG